jgi:hypothetical protein
MTVKQIIRQWPISSRRGMVFSGWSAPMAVHATLGYINKGMVLSVWSLTRWYKQDSRSVRQLISEWGVRVGIEELGSGASKELGT